MRIDHIALYVNDLDGVCDFFVRYFNARRNELYHNPKTGLRTYFLTFEDGARLELMQRPDQIDSAKDPLRTGYTHLAFSVGSREMVDTLTETLSHAGYSIVSGPRTTGDGYYESCVEGPEGNLLEITI